MAKKQKSFADKAAGSKEKEAVYVKYVKSVKSEKTGQWRFNEQMVRSKKGEQLDVALKRMDEVANLVDIDLSQFEIADAPEAPVEDAVVESNETVDEIIDTVAEEQTDTQDADASNENSVDEPEAEESPESGTEESEDQSVDSDSNDETPSENDPSETEEDKPEKKGEDSLEASD